MSGRTTRRNAAAWRGGLIAATSTVAVFAAIIIGITSTPGWSKFHESFLSGFHFRKSFPLVLKGFALNVRVFVVAFVLCLILGMIVAVVRMIPGPAFFPFRLIAIIYTDVFRAVPSIVLIYLFGFGVPGLGLDRPWNNPVIWGTVAIVLNSAASVAEVFRSGIRSLHPSQMAAARSLGVSEARLRNWERRYGVPCPARSESGRRLYSEAEMAMPGDNITVLVELGKPVAIEAGSHFAIREGGKTVGSGVVTEIVR